MRQRFDAGVAMPALVGAVVAVGGAIEVGAVVGMGGVVAVGIVVAVGAVVAIGAVVAVVGVVPRVGSGVAEVGSGVGMVTVGRPIGACVAGGVGPVVPAGRAGWDDPMMPVTATDVGGTGAGGLTSWTRPRSAGPAPVAEASRC